MTKEKVYLVVDCANAPGCVYAVFDDEESALDFRDHYHEDDADVEERSLLRGQHVSCSGYIE